MNTSVVIVNSLSQTQSEFALSCVEDRDEDEEHITRPSYCSHFLPCQVSKLRMMFLFVFRCICCKMLDLAQTNTWCTDSFIRPKTGNTVVGLVFESQKWEWVKKIKTFNQFHSLTDLWLLIKFHFILSAWLKAQKQNLILLNNRPYKARFPWHRHRCW